MTHALSFHAEGSNVVMDDGPWSVRICQADADCLLDIFERVNAIRSHTALYDACQKAGFIPTVSPIRRGPLLVVDNPEPPRAA